MKQVTTDIKGILIGSAAVLAVVIVLVVVIVVLVRRRKAETAVLPQETDWGKTLTDTESANIKRIADALYKDLKGIAWLRNSDLYVEYAQTSDRVFVGVANYFAQTYGNGESLYQWLDSEWWWLSGTRITDGLIDSIKMRLKSFNL